METEGLSSTAATVGDAATVYAAQVLADLGKSEQEVSPEPRTPSPEPPAALPVSHHSVSSQRSSVTLAGDVSEEEECSEALSSLKRKKGGQQDRVSAIRRQGGSVLHIPG